LVKVDLKWSQLLPYNETSLSFHCTEKPGVYSVSAMVDQKLQVVFVGRANKIVQRLRNHKRFFEPNSFLKNVLEEKDCYFRYSEIQDPVDRQNVEYTLFQVYHPSCNIVEPKGELIDIALE
jgi:excinuclease UvrABC nuclease subunit